MAQSTSMISGIASGIDWRTMVDQLIAVDRRSVVLIERTKTGYESKLSEWQSFNAKLLALKTASEALKDPDDFRQYSAAMVSNDVSVPAGELLSVKTSSTAATGSYRIEVTGLASAQKLSSNPFTGRTQELGSGYAGDLVINGKVITVLPTDTLSSLANNINSANTGEDPIGVTATIVKYSANDFRLVLTSDRTGKDGISLLNGSATSLVQKFGWKGNGSAAVKNTVTSGAQSDRFANPTSTIQSLLGLATGEASTGSLTIGGAAVTIDLGAMSLTGIKTAINDAAIPGVQASVVSEVVDGTTYYRLQIEGTQVFQDEGNILNTLGVLDHSSTAVTGKVSGISMTSGGAHITPETLLSRIDGYLSHTAGDHIQLTGTKTGGGGVAFQLDVSSSTTVADLLSAIEAQYATAPGDVVAYVTSEGKIRVDDVAGGGSLSVQLQAHLTSGRLEFVTGDLAFGDGPDRAREIVAGGDATIVVDGVTVTRSKNTIDDVIEGVTLNLRNTSDTATVTLNLQHDTDAVKGRIQAFVSAYNDVMTYINSQFSYDTKKEVTGGILFGDGTLSSIKSDLVSLLTRKIGGVNQNFSIMALVGVSTDKNMMLSIEDAKLSRFLASNFNDASALFSARGSTSASSLSYVGCRRETSAGTYEVRISRAATQASSTGSVDLTAGGAQGALTITQGSNVASVSITSDMTLADIKNAVNSELSAEYAETLVGDSPLQAGGTAITSSTRWSAIDGATLADDDVITFTGTSRAGGAVSGSYKVDLNGTVRDLLSAIESSFSGLVSGSIDTSGRLVLSDRFVGGSQLSLSISAPAGKGLDFGTIDVTAGAGDGSQEGRYAMNITATDDGSGRLVLRSNDYGSGSFTVSQDTSGGNYRQIVYTSTSNTTAASGGAVSVSGQAGGGSGTAWTDIHGASVTNGETITIAGKDRLGAAVTPAAYTIDTAAGTVDDLLTAIQTAFGGAAQVDVFLRDGRIHLEDKTPGASLMELTLTYNGTGTLSLGTFDQATERGTDLGLINGTVAGQDVAGTINGEAATGRGQVLTGNDGNGTTHGLSVKYTGASDNLNAGKLTLTLGVAELFDRALYKITDPIDGYLTFKQHSLQEDVKRTRTRIGEMEARLESRTELLISRFVAMELAMARIQNMSNWLASQVNAAVKGWK